MPARRKEPRFRVVAGGCHEWLLSRDEDGYGLEWVRDRGSVRAHIVAYEKAAGPVPAGLVLDHGCDNPWCVNVAHLRPMTIAANNRRGRLRKLSDSQVGDVRRRLAAGERDVDIARRHGVTPSLVGRIKRQEIWQ